MARKKNKKNKKESSKKKKSLKNKKIRNNDIPGNKIKKKKDKKEKNRKKKKSKKTVAEPRGFADHASNYNVREAISKLRSLKSVEEINLFTKGEERVTVIRCIAPVKKRLESQ